jgi:aldehyde:ferredoxin oxidoreductase
MRVRDNACQRVLHVDLSTRVTSVEDLPREYTAMYLGARGITSRLLYRDVPAGTDPTGPDNCLIIGTGPMDGLPVGMGRLSIATKSPRGCIGEGSVGGFFGPELRRAGYEYISIRGVSASPVYLAIEDESVEIRDATHLWGMTTYETDDALRSEIPDPEAQFLYIGPAAENLVHAAMIFSNRDSTGGRAGGGEVMGAKKLKAITVRGHGGVKPHDYDGFIEAYRDFRTLLDLKTSRDMWTPVWSTYGAPVLSRLFPDLGNLMTNNAQVMSWESDKAEAISSEYFMNDYVRRGQACFNCPWPGCKKTFGITSGTYQGFRGGNYWAGQPVALGSAIDNGDLDLVLVLSGLCNQYGLDIFHVGFTLSWAMECFERGILTTADTDGVELRFGMRDHQALIDLVGKIARKEGFGALLAMGCSEAARVVGGAACKYCLAVKGQELEAIAERNLLMVALGVAVSEVGPDHTRWYPPYPPNPRIITPEQLHELGIDLDLKLAFDTRNPRQKGELLRWFTISRAIVEALPSCVFLVRDTLGLDLRPWWRLFTTVTGVELDYQEFVMAGERVMNLDRLFNVREGYTRAEDHVPYRMAHEDVPNFGYRKIDQATLDGMLDEYYSANGWDLVTTCPSHTKLEELGMGDLGRELQAAGIEVPR